MNLFDQETTFNVSFDNENVVIQKMETGKNILYIARFSSRQPFIITRAKDANGVGFWTSIPEGKQKLAEVIGELISDHIKKNL
ncbi:MAG: hypothetical protein JST75_21205 [Bacteroidetes bacterium]|nr:hypothetical protein [Bacteroidota bacterium]